MVSPSLVRYMFDRRDPAHTWQTKDEEVVAETLRGREFDEPSAEAVEMLKGRGYLTEMTTPEERLYVERLAGFLHRKKVARHRPEAEGPGVGSKPGLDDQAGH